MIVGIGTDILQLSRLQAWPLKRLQRLSNRILTTNEHRLLVAISGTGLHGSPGSDQEGGSHQDLIRFLGVRWAAKEALYKAVYPYRKLQWKDVELLPIHPEGGIRDEKKPVLDREQPFSSKLHATFTRSLPLTVNDATLPFLKTHVSISHDGGLVVAMVVVEGT